MNATISPEDMASFEVLHTQNHSSGSFPSEEYSFLPEVSGSISNGDVNHHVNDNFDLTNMQSALAALPDSSVEVHSQLKEIIDENSSLKEKLNKNNSMMKEQMVTISAWREHMILTKEQQKQSLQKAKERISALERDNKELSEQLQNIEKINQKEKVQSPCKKCEIFENALNHMLAVDSVEDGESMLLDMGYFREHLYSNLKVLCGHLETLSESQVSGEEKIILKSYLMLLKFKIAALEGGNFRATVLTDEETGYEVVYKKKREHALQLEQDVEDLKKALNFKDNELDYLKKEREESNKKLKSYELKVKEYETALKSKFELMNSKLDIEASLSEKYKERCESLQLQVEEYQVKLDSVRVSDEHGAKELHEEVQNLQKILKLEQLSNQNIRDRLAEVMIKCEKLQVDHDTVSKMLEVESEKLKAKNEELTAVKENEIKKHLENIDMLTAQLFEMEEQLRESNAEVRKLQNDLAAAKEENEKIPIFKEQIEEFKNNFSNIESAKNAASDEVERLTNELKKYEKKSDSCPCSCKSNVSESREHRSLRRSSENKEHEVECPFCQDVFRNPILAERHIFRAHNDDN